MNDFNKIEIYLKFLLNTEKGLHKFFKVSSSKYCCWRHRGKIPYEKILLLAREHDFDLNYIFFGKKGGIYYGIKREKEI